VGRGRSQTGRGPRKELKLRVSKKREGPMVHGGKGREGTLVQREQWKTKKKDWEKKKGGTSRVETTMKGGNNRATKDTPLAVYAT